MTQPQTATDNLRKSLIVLFSCVDHSDEAILAAATKAGGALAALGDLMKKFNVSTPADLATAATAAQEEAGKVAQFATKLTEALAALETQDQEKAEEEVDQIAASHGIAAGDKGAPLRKVLLSQRVEAGRAALGLGRDQSGKNILVAADPSKLDAFRKEFPLPSKEEQQKTLLKSTVLASPTTQLGGPHTALPGAQPSPGGGSTPTVPEHITALSTYPGNTNVDRALALLTDKMPGFAKLDWQRQCFLAGRYLETGKAA